MAPPDVLKTFECLGCNKPMTRNVEYCAFCQDSILHWRAINKGQTLDYSGKAVALVKKIRPHVFSNHRTIKADYGE